MSEGKQLAKKSIFMFITNGLGKMLGMISNIIMTRLLGINEYGEFVYVFSLITVISVIPRFGFDQSLLKYIPQNQVNNTEQLSCELSTLSLLVSWVISLIIIVPIMINPSFFSKVLLGNVRYNSQLYLQIGIIFCLSTLFIAASFFQARKEMKIYSAAMNLFRYGFFVIAIFVLFWLGSNTSANAIIAKYVSLVLSAIVIVIIAYKRSYLKCLVRNNVGYYYEFIKFSIPLFLSQSVGIVLNRVNVFMVGYYLNDKSVAIFNSASQIALVTSFMLLSINQVFAPTISKLFHEGNYKLLNRLYGYINIALTILSSIIMLLIVVFNNQIMSLFGSEYRAGGLLLVIISAGQLINAISGPCAYVLSMCGYNKLNLYINIFTLGITIALNIIIIPKMGYIGAAISSAAALTVVNVIRVIMMYRKTKIIPFKVM